MTNLTCHRQATMTQYGDSLITEQLSF